MKTNVQSYLIILMTIMMAASASTIAFSGTMEKLMDLNMPPDSGPDVRVECSHQFSGTIMPGDLNKFKDIGEGQTIVVVCLDSPGGSFAEAIAIGAYLKEKTIGTKLLAGTRCLSACSLIFMAGSYHAHEVGALRWRIMHPTAKLGFHVPSLEVKDGNYNQDSVTKAYKLAMSSVSELIFKLITKQGYLGGDSLKVSLLGHMISTPSDSMFMIDTVDKAGRWDIVVGPTKGIDNLSDAQFYLACENLVRWSKDESAIGLEYFSNPSILSTWVKRKFDGRQFSITTLVDEFNGTDCKFTANEKNPSTKKPIWGVIDGDHSNKYLYSGTFMPGETQLSSLAPPDSTSLQLTNSNQNLCALMQHNVYLEINTCNRTINRYSNRQSIVYTWPTGTKTVLIKIGQNYSVNGAKPQKPKSINGFTCIHNPDAAKTFCYKSTEDGG